MDTVEEYIASYPPDVRKVLNEVRNAIKNTAINAKETISYGMPTYKMGQSLVHFAANKNHLGFYPTPSAIIAFKKELATYKTSKGAIQFPFTKPIPLDLIKTITEFRVQEVTRKST